MRMICEPFWPSARAKVDKIWEHIEIHKALMTETVTLEDIVRAQEARNMALAEHDRAQKFRDYQAFCAVRDEINPDTRYEKLADMLRHSAKGSGSWLDKEKKFMSWLDPVDRTVRCFWLCGIPGAGKLHILIQGSRSWTLNRNREDIPSWKYHPAPTEEWAVRPVCVSLPRTSVGWENTQRSPLFAVSGS